MTLEETEFDKIRKRFHACLDKQLLNDFDNLTPAQLFQYQLSHPEDERVEDYISRLCSPERQQSIQEKAEQLEEEIR